MAQQNGCSVATWPLAGSYVTGAAGSLGLELTIANPAADSVCSLRLNRSNRESRKSFA
jgi:hypothetical protein